METRGKGGIKRKQSAKREKWCEKKPKKTKTQKRDPAGENNPR